MEGASKINHIIMTPRYGLGSAFLWNVDSIPCQNIIWIYSVLVAISVSLWLSKENNLRVFYKLNKLLHGIPKSLQYLIQCNHDNCCSKLNLFLLNFQLVSGLPCLLPSGPFYALLRIIQLYRPNLVVGFKQK